MKINPHSAAISITKFAIAMTEGRTGQLGRENAAAKSRLALLERDSARWEREQARLDAHRG